MAILGFCGGLRKCEMYSLVMDDVNLKNDCVVVKVGPSKTNTRGSFAIPKSSSPPDYWGLIKEYVDLRKSLVGLVPFLMQIRDGKCTKQRIGMNTIARVPSIIARFLGLEEPQHYTSHSLRRSSATALAETGVDILTLKRHGRWKSDNAAERYIQESVAHQVKVAENICFGKEAERSHDQPGPSRQEGLLNLAGGSIPSLNFSGNPTYNGNLTININIQRNQ